MAAMLGVARGMPWGWDLEDWLHGGERRRRCRARERDAWARELRRDISEEIHDVHRFDLCHEDGCHCWCSLDMSPWCPAVKNQAALESVEFDGTYTVGP